MIMLSTLLLSLFSKLSVEEKTVEVAVGGVGDSSLLEGVPHLKGRNRS